MSDDLLTTIDAVLEDGVGHDVALDSVRDLLDGAQFDLRVSDDAMRWAPTPVDDPWADWLERLDPDDDARLVAVAQIDLMPASLVDFQPSVMWTDEVARWDESFRRAAHQLSAQLAVTLREAGTTLREMITAYQERPDRREP